LAPGVAAPEVDLAERVRLILEARESIALVKRSMAVSKSFF
jgi:hypothetical protein